MSAGAWLQGCLQPVTVVQQDPETWFAGDDGDFGGRISEALSEREASCRQVQAADAYPRRLADVRLG